MTQRTKKFFVLMTLWLACPCLGCAKDETIDKAPPPSPNAVPAPRATSPKVIERPPPGRAAQGGQKQ